MNKKNLLTEYGKVVAKIGKKVAAVDVNTACSLSLVTACPTLQHLLREQV